MKNNRNDMPYSEKSALSDEKYGDGRLLGQNKILRSLCVHYVTIPNPSTFVYMSILIVDN